MRGDAHVRFGEEKQGNSPTAPCFLLHCQPGRAFCISLSCWTSSHAVSSAGPWPTICERSWCSTPSTWHWHSDDRNRSSIIAIAVASTRVMRSASDAERRTSCRQWDPSAMPMTTRWPKASSPHLSARSSIDALSRAGLKREWPSSPGSKAGTTRTAGTHRLVTCRRSTTSGKCRQRMLRSQATNRPPKRVKSNSSPNIFLS